MVGVGVMGTVVAALVQKWGERRKTKDVDQATVLFGSYDRFVLALQTQLADSTRRAERAEAAADRAENAAQKSVQAEHRCQQELAQLRDQLGSVQTQLNQLRRDPRSRTRKEDNP